MPLLCLQIVYLDRLGMAPNKWGVFPRVRVWDYADIRAASREDLCGKGGDYGSVGVSVFNITITM